MSPSSVAYSSPPTSLDDPSLRPLFPSPPQSNASHPPSFSKLMDAALALHRALMTQAKSGPINHVFSGRYALTLRGCTQPTRWIDVEVSLPEINGLGVLMKIFDSDGSQFACGTRIRSLSRKCIYIGVHGGFQMPCLLPSVQFLDLLASSGSESPESGKATLAHDAEDLVWLHQNLNADVRAGTDAESKLGKLISYRKTVRRAVERFPFVGDALRDLGFH